MQIKELFDGERIVSLTQEQSLKILASQIIQIAKGLGGANLKLDDLPKLYSKEYSCSLNPQVYQCETIVEVIEKLSDYVQVKLFVILNYLAYFLLQFVLGNP